MNVVNVVPTAPSSAPPSSSWQHIPVLRDEVVELLSPHAGGVYLDVTVGAGGHSAALLQAGAGRLIGCDRDDAALDLARGRLGADETGPDAAPVSLCRSSFSQLADTLDGLGVAQIDGLLADLGVSSMQLDEADRGMSFRAAGPLDMRMDRRQALTAEALIASLSDDELTDLLSSLGEERRARRIARCIKQRQAAGQLHTTADLRRAVIRAVGPSRVGGVDPATRTFQALRMAVNGELDELQALLAFAAERVAPGGVVAIISFHSLEDRMVKRALADTTRWRRLNKKPIQAAELETDFNPRARSAKLRAAVRLGAEGMGA